MKRMEDEKRREAYRLAISALKTSDVDPNRTKIYVDILNKLLSGEINLCDRYTWPCAMWCSESAPHSAAHLAIYLSCSESALSSAKYWKECGVDG